MSEPHTHPAPAHGSAAQGSAAAHRGAAATTGAPTERPSAPRTARERARAELTEEIVGTARRHLDVDGAAGLSLRAVARDLGMVSSAIYRYFPSRDDLLTRLIIDAYNALGEAAEEAEAEQRRTDLRGRWLAIAHAAREWALANPQQWSLIYGSPVPGYVAPQDTIGPASRTTALLVGILADLHARGDVEQRSVPRSVRAALAPVRSAIPPDVPDDLLVRGLMAWTELIGTISLEINGQFHNVIADMPEYYDHVMDRTAHVLELG
ncbi:MAG TPA: TetR/AcrR family transcriptional regulator [Candidatus Nanopelagicales bacterium]|nr:TetR/AcrR family transcriptional regulator [Candidatus Nanopelagicales bacterium]